MRSLKIELKIKKTGKEDDRIKNFKGSPNSSDPIHI